MSALRIGTGAGTVQRPAAAAPEVGRTLRDPAPAPPAGADHPAGPNVEGAAAPTIGSSVLNALGALVKWLPAEIVAGYAAVVTAMQPEQVGDAAVTPDISWAAWIVALVATPALVFFAAWSVKKMDKLAARVGLSIVAFGLWSATVPHSVWEKLDSFKENRPLFLFVLLIVVSIFTLVAQRLVPANEPAG